MPGTVTQVRAYGGWAVNTTLFTDPEVQALLDGAPGGNARIAAADALQAVAASEVMISKVIRTQDLQTDGAAVAEKLIKLATLLRAQGEKEVADSVGADFAFEIVPPAISPRRWPEATEHPYEVWGL